MNVNIKSISILILTPLFLFQTNDQQPNTPTGYFVSSELMTVDLPMNERESSNNGAYSLSIQRRYSNADEEKALKIAEATIPNREVMEVAIKAKRSGSNVVPEVENLWWYQTFNDVRIPYAITGEAVKFFHTLYKQISSQNVVSGFPRCTFQYNTRINQWERYAMGGSVFQDVYVIHMNLEWRLIRGVRNAVQFDKERVVIVDSDHNILGVFGDGFTRVMIS